MLNKDLHLNEKLFEADVEQKATREGYGEGLLKLGEKDPNVVVLSADLSESTHCHKFQKKWPDRFFECGITEQNMAAVGAGLAVSGKPAFIASYATFSPGKNWETVRTTVVYNRANVKVAGHHAGVMTGPDGATHQATEDVAITRCWPGMHVLVPCDAVEAEKATIAAGVTDGPFYIRYTRDKTPIITTPETSFEIGRVSTFWVNEAPVATIFAMGYMLYHSLLAAKELQDEHVPVEVVNVATIKPIDEEGILAAVSRSGAAVSVEDHQVEGGLGSAIAEVLAKRRPTIMRFVGLQNTFAESGTTTELLKKYAMNKDAIKHAVMDVISKR